MSADGSVTAGLSRNLMRAAVGSLKAFPTSNAALTPAGDTLVMGHLAETLADMRRLIL
ncbi:MAG: hypothetical protein ACREFT_04145 [Acetobacteraceae bacterium]